MDPIYVTGHQNPDTDSIVAAIAYASLRNSLGDREYEAACLGRVSDETQIVLNHFGFQPPKMITNIYTQVKDLDYDMPPILSAAVTEDRAWNILREQKGIAAVPVVNEDGTLFGMLSREDVAGYNMELTNACVLDEVPLFNVLSVIEGKVLNDVGEYTDTIAGEVIIAMPESRTSSLFPEKNSIAICGNQPDIIRNALEMNVNCLILCRTELDKEFYDIPTTTCIISTPYDAYRTSRLIFQSTPIGRICRTEDLTCFHLEDRVDEVKELVLKHRESCYPILDADEKVVGVLTRYHLLRPRRKRVVLVDHNEAAQSVPGLEEAEIVEIIDHHRVADIQTSNPIFVRNEPVGSTNTIIAGMFQDKGLIPSEKLAGLIAAAIISDTVMFKSPTCTIRDIRTAERMARYANISLNELGKKIFSACTCDRSCGIKIAWSRTLKQHYIHIDGWSGTAVYGGIELNCVTALKIKVPSVYDDRLIYVNIGGKSCKIDIAPSLSCDDFKEYTIPVDNCNTDVITITMGGGVSLLDIETIT